MNALKRVTFRVDESVRVGWGHMSRCRALAQALRFAGAQVSFYSRHIREETRLALQHCGIRVVDLPHDQAFFDRDLCGEIVVVDGYQFDENFWQRLLAKRPSYTVCIDDWRNNHYVADLVICYNEGLKDEQFCLAPDTRLLLGGRYLLLRPEIHAAARLAQRTSPRRAVMVAAGGSQHTQWVVDLLQGLACVEPQAMIWVLSGQRLRASKVLQQTGLGSGRVRFFHGLNAAGMLGLYRRAHYLIAPASTLMLEAFAAGCPLISGWVAPNQRNSLDFYDRQGLIVNAGDLRHLNVDSLMWATARVRRGAGRMIRRQLKYMAAAQTGMEEIVHTILMSDGISRSFGPVVPAANHATP